MPFFSQLSQQRTRVIASRDAGAPQMPAPDPAGTAASSLLRRYRPLETRATGGFGSVEICLDARLQRRVAIKRIPLAPVASAGPAVPAGDPSLRANAAPARPRDAADAAWGAPDAAPASMAASTTAQALAEARTASMLAHPSIVSVIDFSYDAAYAYLVMEYVDGMSLEEFLAQVEGGSLTYDEVACVADALAQALAYAHENRVLHLDIKPANVLIDRSGHVKLADFGMASLSSAAGFGGARGGTIGYMPPEQLEGLEVDERADVFALAAVLYEALCASAPFRAAAPAESLGLIEAGPTPPSELLPGIPVSAEAALLAALSPDPGDRPGSVSAFADQLLSQLGSPRAGRASLARVIDRLTSDEEAGAADAPTAAGATPAPAPDAIADAPVPAIETDPAEGALGTRFPRARRVAAGVVAGASTAVLAWQTLGAMGALAPAAAAAADPGAGALGRLVCALAVGAAAGAAPQLGSALYLTALVVMVLNATPLVPALPVVVGVVAIGAAWWLTWGRSAPASIALVAAAAAAGVPGASPVAAAPAAALAAYLAAPGPAAASIALALPLSALARAAEAASGALPVAGAAAALADPALWIAAAGLAGAAAGTSVCLRRAWDRFRAGGGAGLYALAAACPAAAAIALGALAAGLAHPMEIASSPTVDLAKATGAGALSSIIIGICAYSLGLRIDPEGDRP